MIGPSDVQKGAGASAPGVVVAGGGCGQNDIVSGDDWGGI